MGFSRQEYWSGLPCSPPGDLPDLGIEPPSLKSPALAGEFFTTSATGSSCYVRGNPLLQEILSYFLPQRSDTGRPCFSIDWWAVGAKTA